MEPCSVRDAIGNPVGETIEAGKGVTSKLNKGGQQLATASTNGIIGLWDRSGRPVHAPIETGEEWSEIAFSADGSCSLTKGVIEEGMKETTLSLWNSAGERLAGPIKVQSELTPRFSEDGQRVITRWLWQFDVQMFDLKLQPLGKPLTGIFAAERERRATLQFSPDGTRARSLSECHGDTNR